MRSCKPVRHGRGLKTLSAATGYATTPLHAPPARRGSPPERPAARRRAAQYGLDRPRRMGEGEASRVVRGDGLGKGGFGRLRGGQTVGPVCSCTFLLVRYDGPLIVRMCERWSSRPKSAVLSSSSHKTFTHSPPARSTGTKLISFPPAVAIRSRPHRNFSWSFFACIPAVFSLCLTTWLSI